MIKKTEKIKKPVLKKYKNEIKAYVLIGIPLIWWGIFFIFALVRAIYFSFTDLTLVVSDISGFTTEHYSRIFAFWTDSFDSQFWRSLGISLIWTAVMMVGNNFLGILLAWLLTTLRRGQRTFLGFLFWPALISPVVGAHIITAVFSNGYDGLANRVLQIFGGEAIAWFNDPRLALYALMVIPFLLGFSGRLIIYYAAMLGVPQSLHEAAMLETNSRFLIFWHVTFPLIKNAIVLNLVLSLIEGIRILAPMQLVTPSGGPRNSTLSVVLYIFNTAFVNFRMGRASAYAVVVFIIILLLTIIQLKITGKEADNVSAG